METIKIKKGKSLTSHYRRLIKKLTSKTIPKNHTLVDIDGLGNYFLIYKPARFSGLNLISGIRIHFV